MSFSATTARTEDMDDFCRSVWDAVPTPKADKRTKIGKHQALLESAVKEGVIEAAYATRHVGGYSASISGHAAEGGTGFVACTLNLLAPLPEEE